MKIYLAGKITGDSDYQVKFMRARQQLERGGHVVLSPAVLPEGLEPGDYMKICFAMIDCADAVAFLPDWTESHGAKLEHQYCEYIAKECMFPWSGPGEGFRLDLKSGVMHMSEKKLLEMLTSDKDHIRMTLGLWGGYRYD